MSQASSDSVQSPYVSINPTTEEVIEVFPLHDWGDVERALSELAQAQAGWKRVAVSQKVALVDALAATVKARREHIAKTISLEMGKVYAQSQAEVDRILGFCQHARERLHEILSPREIAYPGAARPATVLSEPFGVVLCITPWNVPVASLVRLVLPALLGGNVVVAKPAPNVAGCAAIFSQLLCDAGFPDNVFKVLHLPNALAEQLVSDRRIRKLAFVGSAPVGAHLASLAGAGIKPVLLELGGSDPMIVLRDADIQAAALDAARARCTNAGQVCCASKRILVEAPVYDDFRAAFVGAMQAQRCGDPFSADTTIGPLARADLRDTVVAQYQQALTGGAREVLPGGARAGKGYFFTPAVIEEDGEVGFATDREFFGPVASLFKGAETAQLLRMANRSRYGLGAAVYSRDEGRAAAVAEGLEAGFVYLNRPPGLNPYLPFGGVKDSGFGRDCGDEGFHEYLQSKVIIG